MANKAIKVLFGNIPVPDESANIIKGPSLDELRAARDNGNLGQPSSIVMRFTLKPETRPPYEVEVVRPVVKQLKDSWEIQGHLTTRVPGGTIDRPKFTAWYEPGDTGECGWLVTE